MPPYPNKRPDKSQSSADTLAQLAEQSQIDFELEFYGHLLERNPNYVDVLRAHANNLTLKARYTEGLIIVKRLVQLRPNDPLAHYNLACNFALLSQPELALRSLRRAVELGYRNFRYIREDSDLDSIRHDPRFRQLIREFESR